MIVELKKEVSSENAQQLAHELEAIVINYADKQVLVTPSKLKSLQAAQQSFVENTYIFDSDIQLASRDYQKPTRCIKVGNTEFGGDSNNTLVIGGPCSVESEEQIEQSAQLLKSLGLTTLRGGCFKPRTSPYSFQGLGIKGLKLLDKMRNKYGLHIITEVRDATHVEDVIEYADIIQIGAKAMYDHGILKRCGKSGKPVLLKRGFGTTLQEFVQAAEFILSGGNEEVILCERGIRTFETKTRFTLDLCGVAYLKEYTNLPIVLDPSHAIGYAYGVPDLTRACLAMGVDGLLIEAHPNPKVAKSDAAQQLDHDQFKALFNTLQPIAKAIGRTIL